MRAIDTKEIRRAVLELIVDDKPQLEIRRLIGVRFGIRHTDAELARVVRSVKSSVDAALRVGTRR